MTVWQKWKEDELRKKDISSWQERFKAAGSGERAWHDLFLEYRKSDIFREYARKVMIRANGFCEGCKEKVSFLKVIHKTYGAANNWKIVWRFALIVVPSLKR
ncbi:MAG: hypothetical protein JEZ00_20825 [Anaerolineaceae bacterium]|nr:hypothetical protein [Anaerolineaceae bacterium]